MKKVWLILLATCLAMGASGASIGYQLSSLGAGEFQYTYSISGLPSPAQGDTLDISFSPTTFASLVSGQAGDSTCSSPSTCTAGTNWSLLLFPVNSPPGASGDYFATALVANPSLTGPFTADFTLEAGAQASSQPFTIYDSNFNVITTGTTTAVGTPGVPEPTSLSLMAGGLLTGLGWLRLRRRQLR
jgi:hypothetical protein